jgi:Ca-activated chloride channel family protein
MASSFNPLSQLYLMYRFEHIAYLHVLWLIPLLIMGFALYKNWQKRAQKRWGDGNLLEAMASGRSSFKPWLKILYVSLAILLIGIGLANPQIGTKMETVKRQGVDIVFALDVSASMLAEDIAPSRLEKGKYLIARSLDELGGDRLGIIAYAGKAYPLLPITTDYAAARLALSSASPNFIPTPGTALDQALDYSIRYFDPESPASKVLVIMSDGEDHEENWQAQLDILKERGIKVVAMGLGTEQGGPIPQKSGSNTIGYKKDGNGEIVITRLNSDILRELAQQTNGRYVDGSNTNQALDALTETLTGLDKADIEERVFTDYEDQFQWFLAAAFLLLLLELLTPERKSKWLDKMNSQK